MADRWRSKATWGDAAWASGSGSWWRRDRRWEGDAWWRGDWAASDWTEEETLSIKVLSLSGRELAAVDAKPSWKKSWILEAVPKQAEETLFTSRTLLLGGEELPGTLGEAGAASGAELTLLLSPRRLVLTTTCDAVCELVCAATGERLDTFVPTFAHLSGLPGFQGAASFSPDGDWVLSFGGKVAMLFSTKGRESVTVGRGALLKRPGDVSAAAWSGDGEKVLTASSDGEVAVWNARGEGECLCCFRAHGERINAAAFSPSGEEIVTACVDRSAKLWCAASGERRMSFDGHGDAVCSAVLSHDGTRVLTASLDGTAKLWAKSTGDCLCTFGHRDGVRAAAFSPSGEQLLTASNDRTAKLWCASSGNCLRTFKGHQGAVTSAIFSGDGKEVLTASKDSSARLWSARTGKCLYSFNHSHRPLTSAVFSH